MSIDALGVIKFTLKEPLKKEDLIATLQKLGSNSFLSSVQMKNSSTYNIEDPSFNGSSIIGDWKLKENSTVGDN